MKTDSHIPRLTTAQRGPLLALERSFLDNAVAIETWFRQQWRLTPAPFYSSVDLRNEGFKIAPVDTNLFPAGFNNLNPDFMPLCIQAVQATLEKCLPGCLRFLLIPENHTRNIFYLESLAMLHTILIKAGFDVRIGSFREDLQSPEHVELPSGRKVVIEPLIREGDHLGVKDFKACAILLNHDLSGELPPIFEGITQQFLPPTSMGWNHRLKSQHFHHYREVSVSFAEAIGIDPWMIDPIFSQVRGVNFLKREGEAELIAEVDRVLALIKEKYKQYDIQKEPFVVIKADAGTYGMGVMTVRHSDEITQLNRKQRTRMSASKGNQPIDRVLIQEGVYSFETLGEEAVAEPVIYLMGSYVVGGFYRVHTGRGVDENLNAPGMHFEPLAFEKPCNDPDRAQSPDCEQNRFYTYSVVARLAALAAAREIAAAV